MEEEHAMLLPGLVPEDEEKDQLVGEDLPEDMPHMATLAYGRVRKRSRHRPRLQPFHLPAPHAGPPRGTYLHPPPLLLLAVDANASRRIGREGEDERLR